MPRNFKAETLSRILADAKGAQEIPGHKNSYTPDEYNKKRAEVLALSEVENSEYLIPKLGVGIAEYDERGNLKKIGRNRPAMLDLAYYTRNRYEVEKVIPANEKKMGLPRGTYILVVLGNPIVKAITDVVELPKTVKVYRFKREKVEGELDEAQTGLEAQFNEDGTPLLDENGEQVMKEVDLPVGTKAETYIWKYVGAEMITSDRVYKMTRQLKPEDMLELMAQIEDGINDSTNVGGDSLDDID